MTTTTLTVRDTGLGGDYPADWDGFVGQEQAKRQLRVAARSAKLRGVPLDHVLLSSGTPGIGKTSLALLTALEVGTGIKVVGGKITANQARIMLAGMSNGDVLFVDEIHTLVRGGKGNAAWLLNYMQDGVLVGPMGPEEQPKVTVIGATTDAGLLPPTILDRFIIQPALRPYDDEDATQIAIRLAERVFPAGMPLPSLPNMRAIAAAGNNNPRRIRSILINVRDIALEDTNPPTGLSHDYDLTEALAWLGLTDDGLDQTCQSYLKVMLTEFGGNAGERSLVDRLQEPGGLSTCEQVLMGKGLIAKTRAGRVLTQPGIRRARELM